VELDLFFVDGRDQNIKSDHYPLLIPKIPLFSPIRRLYEPEATIPFFHEFSDGKTTPRGEAKAWFSGPVSFTLLQHILYSK